MDVVLKRTGVACTITGHGNAKTGETKAFPPEVALQLYRAEPDGWEIIAGGHLIGVVRPKVRHVRKGRRKMQAGDLEAHDMAGGGKEKGS